MSKGKDSRASEAEINTAILKLEAFANRKLSDLQLRLWMERLSIYPRWRIEKLDHYTGYLNNDVFKYLDELPVPPITKDEVYNIFNSQLQLEPGENKDLGEATIEHILMLGDLKKPTNPKEAEAHWAKEKASLMNLHKQFAHLNLKPSFEDTMYSREEDQQARRKREAAKIEEEKKIKDEILRKQMKGILCQTR
jgi:hypothetical protein